MDSSGSGFVIGKDVGFAGRWFRLIVGLYFSALAIAGPIVDGLPAPAEGFAFLAQVGAYFLLILLIYVGAVYLLGERVLAHANPWISSLLLLGPIGVITLFQLGPAALLVAAGLYYSISSIFNFAMSYGGCEVAAIPSLIMGRRYTIYCPYNAVDAVERAMMVETRAQKTLAVVSIIILVTVGGYFLLVEEMGMVRSLGVRLDVPNQVALLLLIPLGFLAYNTWRRVSESEGWWTEATRPGLIGSATLLVLTVFFVTGFDALPTFGPIMLAAALVVGVRWAIGLVTPAQRAQG